MKKIDEIVSEKIISLAQYVVSKLIKSDITVEKLTQIDDQELEKIKQEYGIEGIILDVDETLRKEMQNIPKCNQEWIENLNGKIKIIVLSNGIDKNIEEYFKNKGIDYIGFAHKPLKRNFIKACNKMEVNPENVLVIGDSLFDDIHGGRKNKMKTLLVKNVEENER